MRQQTLSLLSVQGTGRARRGQALCAIHISQQRNKARDTEYAESWWKLGRRRHPAGTDVTLDADDACGSLRRPGHWHALRMLMSSREPTMPA